MSKTQETEAIPFPDELAHLEGISGSLDAALREAEEGVAKMDEEYMEAKLYMTQNRGEIDPHEMFRSGQELTRIDDRGAFAVRFRDNVAKLKDSPYFARIDFRAADEKADGVFYIGRFAFDHGGKLLVSDWRSPVAGMFYDCEVGPAGYVAPAGRIGGELTRKRQFKIKNGKMIYALESSMNIQDDVLQRELSQSSDEKMKSIIGTIQKEQNRIIRSENRGTLIIQGVAGSGKTSIALHRVAYLLYRQKDRLTAQNVTILSPNRVFGDYISSVLPELGEEPIYEISFEDIAMVQLMGVIGFEKDRDPLEEDDGAWAKRVSAKSTLEFVSLMDDFIGKLPDFVFEPADYTFGRFTATADKIAERFHAYSRHPIKRRLEMIADDLYDRFETDNFWEEELPRVKSILAALKKMLRYSNTLSLYKEFYKHYAMPDLFVMTAKKKLEWNDVYPFLYLHGAFEGLQESGVIRHLVVDEMQDYTPVQYAVLNRLFKCPKTILGDFGQFVNPNHLHTLEDLRELYTGSEFAALNKSYRSTYEIISFAKRIKAAGIDAIERHGEEPEVIPCEGRPEQLGRIRGEIDAFLKSGLTSMGIIAKTGGEAALLHGQLVAAGYDAHLLTPETQHFENGVTVTSIKMSKGLEFDAVLIPDADRERYAGEYDRSLLYIACTRAMHRLTLLYTGDVSELLPN